MSTIKKEIPIFTACDDNYMPFLAVTLQSIKDNASQDYNYTIRILHSGVKAENVEKIMKYNTAGFKIEFVDVREVLKDVIQRLHTCIYYTQTTYFRLFIANLYTQYDKVLYIDSDVVVRGDVAELYNIEIGDNLVGAVREDYVMTDAYIQPYFVKVLGLPRHEDYFNAGLLIMNLDQFRKQDFEGQFVDLLNKYKFVVQDQDYLSVICKGKVAYIDPMWNKSPCNPDVDVEDIKLIHYKLIWKPWKAEIPYGDEFWKYAERTEFKDVIKNIRANYTAEKYQKDIDDYHGFMDAIHNELDNPKNYYHLYLKNKQ